jgi:hypothetical protein
MLTFIPVSLTVYASVTIHEGRDGHNWLALLFMTIRRCEQRREGDKVFSSTHVITILWTSNELTTLPIWLQVQVEVEWDEIRYVLCTLCALSTQLLSVSARHPHITKTDPASVLSSQMRCKTLQCSCVLLDRSHSRGGFVVGELGRDDRPQMLFGVLQKISGRDGGPCVSPAMYLTNGKWCLIVALKQSRMP